ncbi:energy transducer TonB [Spirosoma pomorum]
MKQNHISSRSALLRYVFALPVAALLTMCTQAEKDITKADKNSSLSGDQAVLSFPDKVQGVDGTVYTVVEDQPQFPGGMQQLGSYLSTNLKYPSAAEKANVGGRVFVNFVVTKTGEIKDVRVLKGIGFGADEEAVRVVAAMPRWKPGLQGGSPVNVRYNLPINFALEDDKSTSGKNRADVDFLKGIDHITVNGKEVTKEEFKKVDPNVIVRMDVNKDQGTVAITTK